MGTSSTIKIGLLGGSFDPVHNAHIELAKAAMSSLELDSIQLIPARQPWQKSNLGASPQQRLKMLHIACRNYPYIKINPVEINRTGPTYTIDTLEEINNTQNTELSQETSPNHHYFWIMGSDQLANFCSWYKWQEITNYVTLAVAKRPTNEIRIPYQLATHLGDQKVLEISFDPMYISSTKIRQSLINQDNCSEHLDPLVLKYILENKIYSQ